MVEVLIACGDIIKTITMLKQDCGIKVADTTLIVTLLNFSVINFTVVI